MDGCREGRVVVPRREGKEDKDEQQDEQCQDREQEEKDLSVERIGAMRKVVRVKRSRDERGEERRGRGEEEERRTEKRKIPVLS